LNLRLCSVAPASEIPEIFDAPKMPRVDVAYDLTHVVARSHTRPPLRVLDGVRGVLRAGTATLFIAAPGSGGSVLLRLLTARLGPQPGSSVLFNGATAQELERDGIAVSRLCGYVSEADEHEATLTVRETLEFVERMAAVSAADAAASPERAPTAEEIILISLLGLEEAAATVVGSAAVRGVSGGQRRRLTIAEALLLHPCVLALDKPTTGLDADTALRLTALLTNSARRSGATLVAVLQQPSAEVVACFDEIVLLSEGRELFHGPARGVEEHLASVACGRLQRPHFMRREEFLFELVASPGRAAKLADSGGLGVGNAESAEGDATNGLSVAELAQAFEASTSFSSSYAGGAELALAAERRRIAAAANAAARAPHARATALVRNALWPGESASSGVPVSAPEPAPVGLRALTPYERERFGLFPAAPVARQMRLLLDRQSKLLLRNRPLLAARLVSTVLVACILGSMILSKLLDFVQLYGIALFAAVFFAMSNNVELPTMGAARRIVYRHLQCGL
jgi:ABC-type multidrug transport system ATPase subunit